ncbi:MAG: T9SS type A sorting domain-containing protein [Bacteroidales bacterium]|nr:T9SS type A sorting domain-containing protein [Bacteroidales bacterium]
MKKLALGLFLAFAGTSLFGQVFDEANGMKGLIVDEIPVPASLVGTQGLTANHKTYRFFVEMGAGYELMSVFATPDNDAHINTTTTFWNDENGDVNPQTSAYRPLPTPTDAKYYDSWVTIGGISATTARTQFIPLADDTNGDGYMATPTAVPFAITFLPGVTDALGTHFGYEVSPDGNWSTVDAQYLVMGSVAGVTPRNAVCIGQFTTDGYLDYQFTFAVKITGTPIFREYVHTNEFTDVHVLAPEKVRWNNAPDAAPALNIVAPASINKGQTVAITGTATDNVNVSSIAFSVNGVVVETITTTGNANVSVPYSFSWTCPGGSSAIFAVTAIDNRNQATTQTATATIVDANPTIVDFVAPNTDTAVNMNPFTVLVRATDADETISGVTINGQVATALANGLYSIVYTPTVGARTISASATVNLISGGTAAISATSGTITATNAAPAISFATPVAPFSIVILNDTTFVVNATDADGSVARVDFFIGNATTPSFTDNDGTDGFSFNWAGSSAVNPAFAVRARATDNNGAQTSATITFAVAFPNNGPAYAIESVTTFCSSADVFCLPMVTTKAVVGVTGYDVELKYDNSKVSPTGIVTAGEDLIADRDFTSYKINVVGDTMVRVSLFFNGTAPAGSSFNGNGTVFCVEFSRNYNFGDVDTAEFTMPVVEESYPTYVMQTSAIAGNYYSIKETEFNGAISFWSDNKRMSFVPTVNDTTQIYGIDAPTVVAATVDANGAFTYDIASGESIMIKRDVTNSYDVQTVISGQDAYYTALVTVEDESFIPNVYQIVAMDVNRDGQVSAGDITQMQQRTVANIGEFTQNSAVAKTDWVFVPSRTILEDFSYRVSENYPLTDGIGYSRKRVPTVEDEIALPIEGTDCPIISDENYKGILLGDVTGNYAAAANSPLFKSGEEAASLSFDISEVVNGKVTITVTASSEVNIESYDFNMSFDSEKFAYDSTKTKMFGVGKCGNSKVDTLSCTAFNTGKLKNGQIVTLVFDAVEAMKKGDISFKTGLINEKAVVMNVTEQEIELGLDAASLEVSVSPVPATEELNVSVSEVATIQLVSMLGIVIYEVEASQVSIPVSALAAGSYVVKVINGAQVVEKTVIIK